MTEIGKKTCPFCGKNVMRLPAHIINLHPKIMDKMEELGEHVGMDTEPEPGETPRPPPIVQPQSINTMIREKLDMMLNIKIIEMLSTTKNTTLQDISTAINPPKNTTLEELKQYHDLVYGDEKQVPFVETGEQWVDIAQQAIPIIKDMLPKRKQSMEVDKDANTKDDKTTQRTLKPIREKITGGAEQPSSPRRQPRTPRRAKQQVSKGGANARRGTTK